MIDNVFGGQQAQMVQNFSNISSNFTNLESQHKPHPSTAKKQKESPEDADFRRQDSTLIIREAAKINRLGSDALSPVRF